MKFRTYALPLTLTLGLIAAPGCGRSGSVATSSEGGDTSSSFGEGEDGNEETLTNSESWGEEGESWGEEEWGEEGQEEWGEEGQEEWGEEGQEWGEEEGEEWGEEEWGEEEEGCNFVCEEGEEGEEWGEEEWGEEEEGEVTSEEGEEGEEVTTEEGEEGEEVTTEEGEEGEETGNEALCSDAAACMVDCGDFEGCFQECAGDLEGEELQDFFGLQICSLQSCFFLGACDFNFNSPECVECRLIGNEAPEVLGCIDEGAACGI